VFATAAGTPLDPDNLADRVLAPACEEAGVEWAGFHTFRHTVASRLFEEGRNTVQVQCWLGHHSPSFTLDTYVHLLDGDLGAPLEPARLAAVHARSVA
jgi:integrase